MEELLKKLNDAGVRYVVIGGQAMLQEGMPRFTLDWDLFIPPFDQPISTSSTPLWPMSWI